LVSCISAKGSKIVGVSVSLLSIEFKFNHYHEKYSLSILFISSWKAMQRVSLKRFLIAPTSEVQSAWLKKVLGENSR